MDGIASTIYPGCVERCTGDRGLFNLIGLTGRTRYKRVH